MKISFVSILFGFILIISTSAQAWTVGEEWIVNEKSVLDSIPRFICKIMVVAGSDESSKQEEEEEEEPDCD